MLCYYSYSIMSEDLSNKYNLSPTKLRLLFLGHAVLAIGLSGIMLNMLSISNIIFGDDIFHPIEIGYLVGIRTWGMAISGILIGRITDKYSRKKIYSISLIFVGFSRFLNGFAPAGQQGSYEFFLVCYALSGLFQGGVNPALNSYLNDAMDHEVRSRFLGKLESVRQSSQIIGMISSAILIQVGYWRVYFISTGLLIIVASIIILVVLPEPKRGSSHHQLKDLLKDKDTFYKYQLTKETVKSTVFSPTNIIAFIEGISTWILFSIAMYMLYPYIQSAPYNISPFATGIMMIIFGLPGAVVGAIAFGKISDKLGAKDIINRVYLIFFSISTLFIMILLIFIIPLPRLTPSEGNNVWYLLGSPMVWALGLIIFVIRAVLGIYNINQTPIIQKVNLPEAQGTVHSWNQFLETIGFGLGPIIAGYILNYNNNDYFTASFIAISLGLPGACLWLLSKRWIHKDVARIQALIDERSIEMNEKRN
jgi:MFS family permease